MACDMFKLLVLLFVIASATPPKVQAQGEVSCDFQTVKWRWEKDRVLSIKTCVIGGQTIDAPGFSISSEKSLDVKGFIVENNKDVKHLPENIGDVAPELLTLHVRNSSLKKIERKMFKNLSKLERLNLEGNEIIHVESNSFKDLSNLQILRLDGRFYSGLI